MLCTVMSMVVPRFIPRELPTTFGTVELAERARRTRRGRVWLLEPPVDLEANRPGVVEGQQFRAGLGIGQDEVCIVMVCRLESWLKLESLQRSIAAVEALARELPVRLVIVGEGSARDLVAQRAAEANAAVGRDVVLLAGAMADPRPAYEAADVMVGMGGSALRTMAFGKPLVVVGERGFSRVLDGTTAGLFQQQGWYGLGTGTFDDLEGQLRRLVTDPLERKVLGELGRSICEERYDLVTATKDLVAAYHEVSTHRVSRTQGVVGLARTKALVHGRAAQKRVVDMKARLIKEIQ
jgi:glycosyltransferase involved in cell wall biosynthesis